jgi:hypothetical protein
MVGRAKQGLEQWSVVGGRWSVGLGIGGPVKKYAIAGLFSSFGRIFPENTAKLAGHDIRHYQFLQ